MSAFSVDPHKLEEVMNYCLGFAKQMLEAHGEFYPFGSTLVPSGAVTATAAHLGEERPKGSEMYRVLHGAMRAQFQKREILAAGLASNVNIPPEYRPAFPDGIR